MPDTQIFLANVPLENDYKNTLTFNNSNTQHNYFMNNVTKTYNDYNYQRKDNAISVHDNIENIRLNNYVFYQNTNFSNKWFYCFITSMEYVNDETTRIFIETDVIQTWLFDINYRETFIEREHVNDDDIGSHTVPEGLETGEYIVNNTYYDTNLQNTSIVMASTVTPSEGISLIGGNYNGIYSGSKYYTYSADNITSNLQFLADENKIDGVTSLFLAPTFLCDNQGGVITNSSSPKTYDLSYNKLTSLNGYTPRNKKLLTYPYCYLELTNENGSNAIYHQELFSTSNMQFSVYGALTPGCSIKAVPRQYKGMSLNFDYGINAGKYPQLNWATDMFTNWVTQNGVNIATDIASNIIGTAGNIASSNVTGAVSSLFNIANSVRQVQLADKIPPQARGNLNSGDVTTSALENTFHFMNVSIKSEYARIIDDYFDMFGYKINRVKSPNITGRRNWNYVKTINCNFTGNIPQDDMRIIKQVFDNGITLWHNPATIFDYSQNNDII